MSMTNAELEALRAQVAMARSTKEMAESLIRLSQTVEQMGTYLAQLLELMANPVVEMNPNQMSMLETDYSVNAFKPFQEDK